MGRRSRCVYYAHNELDECDNASIHFENRFYFERFLLDICFESLVWKALRSVSYSKFGLVQSRLSAALCAGRRSESLEF